MGLCDMKTKSDFSLFDAIVVCAVGCAAMAGWHWLQTSLGALGLG